MKFLMSEKCKLYKIYRRIFVTSREVCFSQRLFTIGLNWLKKIEIIYKMKTDQAVRQWCKCSPEIVDSVNSPILADRRIRIENIFKPWRFSVGTAHKIIHDGLLPFLRSLVVGVPKCWHQSLILQRKPSINLVGTAAISSLLSIFGWPSRLWLYNIPTASLQRGRTPPMNVLDKTLNNLMVRF